MTGPHSRKLMLVASLVAILPMGAEASAQYLPFDLPPLIPNEPMTVRDLPNVPDERGCVKWCIRDESPCDPPSFKRADNRCSNYRG